MFEFKINLLFDAPNVTGDSGGSGDLSKDDILTELNIENDPNEEEQEESIELGKDNKTGKEKSEKTDSDSSTDEENTEEEGDEEKSLEDEIEEELKEPNEEELELNEVYHSRRDILKEFPDLFKKFPGLEKAYFREQRYAELLPTLDDARIAVEKAGLLDKYGRDLAEGNIESVLKNTKETNVEAFHKIADNYMQDLFKADKEAYFHVLGNTGKDMIASMVKEGREKSNNDLINAAKILNKFLFGTDKYEPPRPLARTEQKNDKEEQLTKRERELEERRIKEHVDSLDTKINNSLKSTIDKYIDTNGKMTPYIRNKATVDVQEELESVLSKDTRFVGIMNKLYERAIQDEFSDESTQRIKSAMFNKAKVLLPDIIKKIRREALSGRGDNVQNKERDKKGPLPVGQHRRTSATPSNSGKTNSEKARQIPKSVSTLDFLNQD